MATANPFYLLGDDDNDDPSHLLAAHQQKLSVNKPAVSFSPSAAPLAKLPSKPLPPAQAVKELKSNSTAPVRGGSGRGGLGRGGSGRGASFVQNRYLGSRNSNGYSGGVPPEDGDAGKTSERDRENFGPPQESFRGGRSGWLVNGNAEERFDPGRPQRRAYDRRSGTARGFDMKRDGAGRGNWGTATDDFVAQETEKGVNPNEKASEKLGQKERQATDISKDKGDASNEAEEKEPADNEMTLEEYEKVREEKRRALLSLKVAERKVEFDRDFKEMQQLSIKKKGNDDVFVKVGTDKDFYKRRESTEKERAKKAVTINEFLKPTEGEGHSSPGGLGRGRGRGSLRGGYGGNLLAPPTAPSIEDPTQFPTLGGK